MDPRPIKWKRIAAREFLLLVGVAAVCGIVALFYWTRNQFLERRIETLHVQMDVLRGSVAVARKASNWPPPEWDGKPTVPDWIPPNYAERIMMQNMDIERVFESDFRRAIVIRAERRRLIDSLYSALTSRTPPSVIEARVRLHDMRMEYYDLHDRATLKRMELLTAPEIWQRTQWMALLLLTLLYPLRLLILGVLWSLRVLRSS